MWKLAPGLVLIASAASASPFEGPQPKATCRGDCRVVQRVAIPKASRRVIRAIEVRATAVAGDFGTAKMDTSYSLAVRTPNGWWVRHLGHTGLVCGFDHAIAITYELPTIRVKAATITFDGVTCRFDGDTPSCR